MIRRLLLLWLCCCLIPAGAQSLRDLDDNPLSVTTLLAPEETETLVLVVWCTQCGSCRGVEDQLEAYAEEAGPEVQVFAVTPHPVDSPERVRAFLKQRKSGLRVLRDPTQALVSALKIDRTTTTLVYDKTGKLRYLGPFQKDQIAEAVEAISSNRAVEPVGRPLRGCPIPGF